MRSIWLRMCDLHNMRSLKKRSILADDENMENSNPSFEVKLSRFGNTSNEEKKRIMLERNSVNTNKATKTSLSTFRDYLREKELKPLEEIADSELPDILHDFYTNARKTDGSDYCVQTMKCIRAGINRHLKAERGLDIIDNTAFTKANEMFRGVNKQKRIQGKGSTKSTPVICPEDLQTIYKHFNHDIMNNPEPRKLQQCLIFYIIYYFCRRGRENLYTMTSETFKIDVDNSTGKRFVFQNIDEHDKNHGIDNPKPANEARMYETTGTNSIKLYQKKRSRLSKHNSAYPWQRP